MVSQLNQSLRMALADGLNADSFRAGDTPRRHDRAPARDRGADSEFIELGLGRTSFGETRGELLLSAQH
jgi:hypothetical protein